MSARCHISTLPTMLKLQTSSCTGNLLQAEARVPCCQSRECAASSGHIECFKTFPPYSPGESPRRALFSSLCTALHHGHVAFAIRLLDDQCEDRFQFARHCLLADDAVSLRFAIRATPGLDLAQMCYAAGVNRRFNSLRVLLENGAPWKPGSLLNAILDNRLDILELVLPLTKKWCPRAPTLAACLGHVRFLMRIFEAGCPVWTSADDGEHYTELWQLPDWCLLVSSDLVRSGPVLLYAAQKGAPLTPRMEGMLGDVRRRALALAGCFRRASRLSEGSGERARKWDAMGRVPVEIIERIATLTKLSIISRDLVV